MGTVSGDKKAVDGYKRRRLEKLKDHLLEAPQKLDNERLKLLMEIYPKLDGEPGIVRRAKLLEHILKNKTLYIDENFFVGSISQYVAGVYAYPEWNVEWMKDESGKAISHLGEITVSDRDRELFGDVVEYFDKRSLYYKTNELFEELYGYCSKPAQEAGLFYDANSWPAGGGNLNYTRVMNEGLASMIKGAEEKLASLIRVKLYNKDRKKVWFYKAAIIVMKAVITLANRYAELAKEMAQRELNAERKQELLEIAEICKRVPEHPARNFKEAMQSFFLIHVCSQIEATGCGYSLGYWGQNMEPFYQRDKAEGKITPEEALYLTKLMFIKIQEIGYYHGPKLAKAWSSHVGQTIALGGYTADGKDATGEMDYIVLEAHRQLQNIQPPTALMWHPRLKEDFLMKVVDLLRTGIGHPQIMNADIAVMRSMDRYKADGITIEEARRTCVFGCVATAVENKTCHPTVGEPCIAKAFELALNNGVDPVTGMEIGPKTGDPEDFTTFEELWDAFKIQTEYCISITKQNGLLGNNIGAEDLPFPLRSVLIDDCLETGTHIWDGGSRFVGETCIIVGTVDAANSLLAVKDLVFDNKRTTMKELKEALAANFEGYGEIYRMCLDAPKHGNDIAEVNEFVREVYDLVYDIFEEFGDDYLGRKSKPDAYSNSLHNMFGALIGALPEGRLAGVALTDGSVSALPGSDTEGPTALVNSAAKALDTVNFNSNHFNMKFNPSALEGSKGARNLLNLIKTYMDQGGSHIQFNVVKSETLKDAQLHPDKYKDLVVRVAGFSAYFTRLDEGVQNEIIKRSEMVFN
ncbi:MAG TPA: pyruvate formate lyase family protein [Clostridia bacterium]|nr:pyruvate formate lyase family protein [Clostridia bacterium]